MPRVAHVIGNGDHYFLYKAKERRGLKLACNLPPFPIDGAYATAMVDFKMMRTLTKGEIHIPGHWILGFRPKLWMEKNPQFYMKVAKQVKEFYTVLPKYCPNYTDFNCGHFAVHYLANKMKADRVHMYGFDSIFDFNLRSTSDHILYSDRDGMNTNRLATNWRPVWQGIFNEFPNTEFVLHHVHDNFKMPVPDNARVQVYTKQQVKQIKM